MGSYTRVWPFFCCTLLLLVCWLQLISAVGDGCGGAVRCVRCEPSNSTGLCGSCSQLVVLRRQDPCTQPCPPGYVDSVPSLLDYMAATCSERVGGVSGEVVGVAVGLGICAAAVGAAALYCRIKRHRKPPPSLSHSSQGSDESEWLEFVKQICELRREAPVFLAMLNDTRRQVRALRSHSALQPYKPVLKDLSRILILLNRSEERLGAPPPDWETLLAWGHRVLNRYKKHHPNQVSELVSFLSGGGGSEQQLAVSVFDTNYNTRKACSHSEWHEPHASQLDDFFTLGFRPQDEITTEL